MDNKFVITIGRQFGSCGKEIGQELAKRFGITFYDKELISLASKESGLCQEFFEKADEKNSGNLLQAFAAGFTFGPFQYNDFLSNDKLFQIQSDVIRKVAGEHSCVIVGRCADYILRDNKRCINVFVHADMEIIRVPGKGVGVKRRNVGNGLVGAGGHHFALTVAGCLLIGFFGPLAGEDKIRFAGTVHQVQGNHGEL